MILKCNKCQFLFNRITAPSHCPDCGSEYIVEANSEEQQEFEALREEFGSSDT